MSQHTPGPWEVIQTGDNPPSLIAAAPELLAALQQCLAAMLQIADDESADPDNALYWNRPQGHGYQMVQAAKAAIAKARGES